MVCEKTSWKRKVACTFYACICRVDSLVVGWVKAMSTCICFVTILLNLLCLKNGQTIVLKTYPQLLEMVIITYSHLREQKTSLKFNNSMQQQIRMPQNYEQEHKVLTSLLQMKNYSTQPNHMQNIETRKMDKTMFKQWQEWKPCITHQIIEFMFEL